MTLDKFITVVQKDLATFKTKWRKENIKDPNGYPLKMDNPTDPGMWWEQFTEFVEFRDITGESE